MVANDEEAIDPSVNRGDRETGQVDEQSPIQGRCPSAEKNHQRERSSGRRAGGNGPRGIDAKIQLVRPGTHQSLGKTAGSGTVG